MALIEDHAERAGIPPRFAASKLAEGDRLVLERLDLDQNEKDALEHTISQMEAERGGGRSAAIADMRFGFIGRVCEQTVVKPTESREHARSTRIDKLLTGPFTAIPAFVAIMALVFWLTFNVVGAWLSELLDAGISDIWAKSVSKEHARILQRIGARHIINAETDAGKRVGHLVSGNYLDYIELEGAYSVVKIHTPPHVVGYSIEDARVHERFGITVVGVKSPGKEFEYGSKELIMHRNDELIIMGKQDQIDKFLRG